MSEPTEECVLQVLKDFGYQLTKMGAPVWKIQADALSKTAYAGDVGKPSVAYLKEAI